jgi:hypothetical protein
VSVIRAATSWLVEPAEEPAAEVDRGAALRLAPGSPGPDRPPALRIAVIGSGQSAPALAAAVALSCRARARVPAALVAIWRSPGIDGPPPGPSAPVLPGAAALAARLARRDLPVLARGRLIWLALPGASDAAEPVLRRAEAAAGDVPVVLALARPREAAVDAVLAGHELALVAAPPGSPLADAALRDVDDLRIPSRACAPLPPGVARMAALAGLRGPHVDLGPVVT